MSELLPWQQDSWHRIQARIDGEKLPHGLLLSGPADTGKSVFVEHLARYFLCPAEHRTAGEACGKCSQCLLINAGTHPDYLTVTLEDSKQIKIEQIRDMIHWAQQTAQQGGGKICVIDPADKLNLQSANALLKCLEEPPAATVICLVTEEPARLLPTIRSRCQPIMTQLPARELALDWLRSQQVEGDHSLLLDIAGGSPLRVVRTMDEDYLALRAEIGAALPALSEGRLSPIRLASTLASRDPIRVLDLIYHFTLEAIKFEQAGVARISATDQKEQLASFAKTASGERRQVLLDRVCEAKSSLLGTSNANAQMLLEWVFAAAA